MALGLAPRRIPTLVALGSCAALLIVTAQGAPAGAAQRPCRDLPVKSGTYTQNYMDEFGRQRALITFTSSCKSYGTRRRPHWGSVLYGFDGSVACSSFNEFDDGRLGDALKTRPNAVIRLGAPRKFHIHYRRVIDRRDPDSYAIVDIRGRLQGQRGPAVGTIHYSGPLPPPDSGQQCNVTTPFRAEFDRRGGARP